MNIKTVLAIAAIVATSAVHARGGGDWRVVSGTGTLTFSADALNALNAAASFILTEGAGNKAHYDDDAKIGFDFTGGTTAGDQVRSLVSTGSSVVIERKVMQAQNIKFDSTIVLRDWKFNLDTKTLSADMKGVNLLTGVVTEYGFSPIFTAAGIEGGQIEYDHRLIDTPVNGTASSTTVGKLALNRITAYNFLNILGLPYLGGVADLVKNADWGVATASALVTVPEPSAYLSALAGITVLGVARLRHMHKAG